MDLLTNEAIYQKSPQQLTALLYEGLMEKLEEAIELIEKNQFVEANKKLQGANDILHRLGVGIKYEAGAVAEQLDTLYNYMANELIAANIKKDKNKIKNVLTMIESIAVAWNEAIKLKTQSTSHMVRKVSAYENSIMRSTQ